MMFLFWFALVFLVAIAIKDAFLVIIEIGNYNDPPFEWNQSGRGMLFFYVLNLNKTRLIPERRV